MESEELSQSPFSHQQHSSENSTTATQTQHIDMQAKGSTLLTSPNLSESNKNLIMALGLEEVYKRMAENHKFHIDIVRGVAASQQCLEQVDWVLYRMRKAAEHEYACHMKQEFGVSMGVHQTEEIDEEEEEEEEEEGTKKTY